MNGHNWPAIAADLLDTPEINATYAALIDITHQLEGHR
jgi:hypothetical protein